LVSGFSLLLVSPIVVHGLTVLVSHGGSGDLELCLESKGYEDQCHDFNLSEYANPLQYILDVEDPDEGHNFRICYDLKDTDAQDCKNFEFTESSQQTVNIDVPSNVPPTEDGGANNSEDFSLQHSEGDSDTTVPDLPPLPPTPP